MIALALDVLSWIGIAALVGIALLIFVAWGFDRKQRGKW